MRSTRTPRILTMIASITRATARAPFPQTGAAGAARLRCSGMDAQPLAGRTVAVPETRELAVFAAMLEPRGARVLRCPLVAIRDAPEPAPVLAFARAFAGGACDDLILTTGEGLRRILACIERHEPELRAAFLAALARVRKITRGPKPARALREVGLKPDLPAPTPTTAGVIAALRGLELKGRRLGVQLYATEPNTPLVDFPEPARARLRSVAPYVYPDAPAHPP